MENIQLTLESSTTSLSLNSDSIYLNPEIDGLAGLPEIRTTSGVNAGYNGGWTSAQFYDARLITIRGVIANSDISVVEDRRKALVGLLGQGRKEELTLHFVTAGGNSYVLNCRTISCEMALSGLARKQEFLIQLRADDPLIYDDGALATEAIVNVRRALGGFQIDFGLPLYIGGGVNETLVENGNETVYPVINLYGPLHSPTIINQTTNQQMQVLTDLDYTLTWVNPVEVTGDYILVTNETDKESPLSSVELLGDTTQDTLSGKNLLRLPDAGASSGITYSINSDGTFNLHGTNSANYEVLFTYYIDSTEFQSTNYTLSANKALPDGAGVRLEIYNDTTWKRGFVAVNSSRQSQTATPNFTDANRVRVAVSVGSGKTVNIDNLGVMLEKSSSVSAFEKFCGGVPSPNPDFPQTVQTTTGEQVVKMNGKNLLNYTTIQQTTKNGVSCSLDSDGTITLNGTCTANNTAFVFDNTNIYLDGTYTLSFWVLGGSVSNTTNDTAIRIYQAGYTQGLTVRLTNGPTGRNSGARSGVYVMGNIRVDSGVVFNNYQIRIQLEKNSERTDFEPYQSQSYEVNLGKNLFDKDNAEIVHLYSSNNGTVANANAWAIILPCQPSASYAYSNIDTTAMKADSSINFYATKPTEAGIAKIGSQVNLNKNATVTFTTPAGANWMLLYYRWNASDEPSAYAGMMIERGSKATTYAPYFTPIELCKLGDYQDKIYKSGDDWFVHKEVGKIVQDGTVQVTYYDAPNATVANQTLTAYFSVYGYNTYVNGIDYKCNMFGTPYERASAIWGNNASTPSELNAEGIVKDGNALRVRILKTRLTGWSDSLSATDKADLMKTWLNSNTPIVYGAKSTATDTQITNQALIDQLEALASSTLFVGVNNIALVPSGGAQGELSIDYFSAYTEDRDIVVIDSQARTITKNGADIYYLKADGSEFPTLAPGENTLYLTSEQTSDEGYAEIKFKQGYLSI